MRAGPIYFYIILQTIVILAADCLSQFTEAKVPVIPQMFIGIVIVIVMCASEVCRVIKESKE